MKELTVIAFSKFYEGLYKQIENRTTKEIAFAAINNAIVLYCLLSRNFKEKQTYKFDDFHREFLFEISSSEYNLEFEFATEQIEKFLRRFNLDYNVVEKLFGNVLEMHINQKGTGSYYTPDDTTTYITYNSILISAINNSVEIDYEKICKVLSIKKSSDIINNGKTVEQNLDILKNSLTKKEKQRFVKTIESLKIIDPTCGSGAFVIKAFETLEFIIKMFGETLDYSKILSALYGVDIEKEAVQLTKLRLLFKVINKSINVTQFNDLFCSNFFVADALRGSDYRIEEDGFDWKIFNTRFDCIIGNPPYVEKKYVSTNFETNKCGNLYAYTIERACNIANHKAIISFIVPLSLVSTNRMLPAKNYLENNSDNVYYATFADRPSCIFSGVHQRLTIFFAEIGESEDKEVYSSSYKYWYNSERYLLYSNMTFIKNEYSGILPKIGSDIEKNIYEKILSLPDSLSELFVEDTEYSLYVSTRIGFWVKAFSHNVFTSKEYKEIFTQSEEYKDLLLAIINSSIFYFYWVVTSDCWHITNLNFKTFKLEMSKFIDLDFSVLHELVGQLMEDLEKNKKYIGSKQTDYEYKHKYSKGIIDAIDDFIAPLFSLNMQELTYIKKYTEKYRINTL